MDIRIGTLHEARGLAIALAALAMAMVTSLNTPRAFAHGEPTTADIGEADLQVVMEIDGVPHMGIFHLITSTDDPEDIEAALDEFGDRFPNATVVEPEPGSVVAQAVIKTYKWPDAKANWGYNSSGAPASLSGGQQAAEAAAATWNAAGSNFQFTFTGATPAGTGACNGGGLDGHNTVGFRAQADNILAVTCSWSSGTTVPKNSVEFDMEIDPDWAWTTGTPMKFDLQSIITHEFGHALGLGHSPLVDAVMYHAYGSGEDTRTLHQDDIDGVIQVYGASQQPAPAANDPAPSNGGQDRDGGRDGGRGQGGDKGGDKGKSDGGGTDGGAQGPNFPAPPEAIRIEEGASFVTWPYADTPATKLALTGNDIVYGYNPATRAWERYSPLFAPPLNTLDTLRQGYAYWFMTSESLEVSAAQVGP